MPAPPERLAALQKQFADHIRDPEHHPAPAGVEDRRMAIYRRLFFNNLSNLFSKNFPRVRKIVDSARWQELIRAFMDLHRSKTPIFPELGREFVRFLAEHPEQYEEWPWLAQLADWEFLATSVRNDEDDPSAMLADSTGDPERDLLAGPLIVNPTLRLASYDWPVHLIRANQMPEQPQAVILAVFRKTDDRIGRSRINVVTARLIELLQENPSASGQHCLERLAKEMQHPDPQALLEHGRALLASLVEQSIVLGRAG